MTNSKGLRRTAVATLTFAALAAGGAGIAGPAMAHDLTAGPVATVVQAKPWPVYRKGSSGPNVKALQYFLRGFTFTSKFNVTPDGAYGAKTEQAVKAFQSWQGLKQDGVTGATTWAKIASLSKVQNGSKGEHVKAAQTLLAKQGYQVSVDGAFGPSTLKAVKAFQRKAGLAADGIVGAKTWDQLVTR